MSVIVIAAGGTGGHVFPALALAGELVKRGARSALITDKRGDRYCESFKTNEEQKVAIHIIRAGTLSMCDPIGSLRGLIDVLVGTITARGLLKHLEAGAVVGFGGYPSFPTMTAALQAGLPTMIHEQNAALGRVNQRLARRVKSIALTFPDTQGLSGEDHIRTTLTGTPVRGAIASIGERPYVPPRASGPLNILVLGGSQGAAIFSSVIPEALGHLPIEFISRLKVEQQCREEDQERVHEAYKKVGLDSVTAAFFDDLPSRLKRAHLVIARAGATTVSELQAAGRPAILIPFTHAVRDHQTDNARAITDLGGGWLIKEASFTPESLRKRVAALLTNTDALVRAAGAARGSAKLDATTHLADLAQKLLYQSPRDCSITNREVSR